MEIFSSIKFFILKFLGRFFVKKTEKKKEEKVEKKKVEKVGKRSNEEKQSRFFTDWSVVTSPNYDHIPNDQDVKKCLKLVLRSSSPIHFPEEIVNIIFDYYSSIQTTFNICEDDLEEYFTGSTSSASSTDDGGSRFLDSLKLLKCGNSSTNFQPVLGSEEEKIKLLFPAILAPKVVICEKSTQTFKKSLKLLRKV